LSAGGGSLRGAARGHGMISRQNWILNCQSLWDWSTNDRSGPETIIAEGVSSPHQRRKFSALDLRLMLEPMAFWGRRRQSPRRERTVTLSSMATPCESNASRLPRWVRSVGAFGQSRNNLCLRHAALASRGAAYSVHIYTSGGSVDSTRLQPWQARRI